MGNVILLIMDYFFQSMSKITSFLLEPLFKWAVNYNLLSYNYLDTVQEFLNTYFYKYIKFARDVLINITGLPVNLFIFLMTLLAYCLILYFVMLGIRFLLNAWSLYRTGKSMGGIYNSK